MSKEKTMMKIVLGSSLVLGAANLSAAETENHEYSSLGSGAELRTELMEAESGDAIAFDFSSFFGGEEEKSPAEGKCGEGKCGEGKCGEESDEESCEAKAAESKCGEGNCGEGNCGAK